MNLQEVAFLHDEVEALTERVKASMVEQRRIYYALSNLECWLDEQKGEDEDDGR